MPLDPLRCVQNARVMSLAWGKLPPNILDSPPDVVVGADLLYDPSGIAALVETLVQLLRPSPPIIPMPRAYLGVCKRNPATYEAFLHAAEVADLICKKQDCGRLGVEFVDVLEDCILELFVLSITCNR